jgi:trimethylamine--corrinoid protein Co-methyltransferase
MVRRYRRGIEVDSDTLAFDVISRVAHGGNFLLQEHTVERCRTEFWQPVVCDRRGWEPWVEAGRPDAVAHARQRWGKLLSQHEDPPLDETIKRQLQTYIDEREH